MKPRIAVNISNCVSGGGQQIALWFIDRLRKSGTNLPFDVTYIVNQQHLARLDLDGCDVLAVAASPMRSLKARRQIHALLASQDFALLFSLFGPSGISHPRQISGLANAYVTSLNRQVLQSAYRRRWLLHYLRFAAYGRMMTRNRAIIFETQGERDSFVRRLNYPLSQTHIVANSVNDIYLSASPASDSMRTDTLRILFVTANQPHKNNHMIPAYADALRRAGFSRFTLALTLTAQDARHWLNGAALLSEHLDFLGTLPAEELLHEYQKSHIVALPSSLETHSGVYNEVRYVPRALLASDRPFAREICGSFAHFFEPLDAGDFVRAVSDVVADLPKAEQAAWDARHAVLSPEQKFRQMLEIIQHEIGLANRNLPRFANNLV